MEATQKIARLSPVRDVQAGIRRLEALNDEMIACGGEVLAGMMEVTRGSGMTLADSQPAISAHVAWLGGMVELRARGIDSHEAARVAIGTVDLREMGWGALTGCPSMDRAATRTGAVPLRAVAR